MGNRSAIFACVSFVILLVLLPGAAALGADAPSPSADISFSDDYLADGPESGVDLSAESPSTTAASPAASRSSTSKVDAASSYSYGLTVMVRSPSDVPIAVETVVSGKYLLPFTEVKARVFRAAMALAALPEGANETDVVLDFIQSGNATYDAIQAAEEKESAGGVQSGQGNAYGVAATGSASRKLLSHSRLPLSLDPKWLVERGPGEGLGTGPDGGSAVQPEEGLRWSSVELNAERASAPPGEDVAGGEEDELLEAMLREDTLRRLDAELGRAVEQSRDTAPGKRRALLADSASSSSTYPDLVSVRLTVRSAANSVANCMANVASAIEQGWMSGNATELGMTVGEASVASQPTTVTRPPTWPEYVASRKVGYEAPSQSNGWIAAAVLLPISAVTAALLFWFCRPVARARRARREAFLQADAVDRAMHVRTRLGRKGRERLARQAVGNSFHIRATTWGAGTSGAWGLPTARIVEVCEAAEQGRRDRGHGWEPPAPSIEEGDEEGLDVAPVRPGEPGGGASLVSPTSPGAPSGYEGGPDTTPENRASTRPPALEVLDLDESSDGGEARSAGQARPARAGILRAIPKLSFSGLGR